MPHTWVLSFVLVFFVLGPRQIVSNGFFLEGKRSPFKLEVRISAETKFKEIKL